MEQYRRVLPRDLFNEGNLLTNIGRLWILLDETLGHKASIIEEDVDHFDIVQNQATGGLTVRNLTLMINGNRYYIERPMNSREKWPLIVTEKEDDYDFEEVEIFNEDGNFTDEMIDLINS